MGGFYGGGVPRAAPAVPLFFPEGAFAFRGQIYDGWVFVRADLNVPLGDQGQITEDTRIRASVPGIRLALDAGAGVVAVTRGADGARVVTATLSRPRRTPAITSE